LKVRNLPIQSKNRGLYLKKKKENKIKIILKKKQKLQKKNSLETCIPIQSEKSEPIPKKKKKN
jgi:hypothetical protein